MGEHILITDGDVEKETTALANALPNDLAGWTVLDVGRNGRSHRFELARRGAKVTAVGVHEVYDLAREDEQFDVVLFLGALYHLRHPLLALDILAGKARELFVMRTLSVPGEDELHPPVDLPLDERDAMLQLGWPKLAFIEGRLAGDATNWWAPNHACVAAMLRSAGLQIVARSGHELYVCRPGPTAAAVTRELDAATGR